MNKHIVLLLSTMLAASSLILVESAFARSIPKPSVPEFTVKYVDGSYYVSPVYGIDQYSGKTVQTGGGFTVENKTIVVTIKNQPFTPYKDENDKTVELWYQVFYKGHFVENWRSYPYRVLVDPSSSNTFVVFGLERDYSYPYLDALSPGDQIDFQVQALLGYFTFAEGYKLDLNPLAGDGLIFHGESSKSSIQTFTFRADASTTYPDTSSPSTSPNTNGSATESETSPNSKLDQITEPSPSQTSEPVADDSSQTLGIFFGTAVTTVLIGVSLLVYFGRRRHQTLPSSLAPNNN